MANAIATRGTLFAHMGLGIGGGMDKVHTLSQKVLWHDDDDDAHPLIDTT